MNRRAAIEGARTRAASARSLLSLALLTAALPAFAQQAPPDAATTASTADTPPVAMGVAPAADAPVETPSPSSPVMGVDAEGSTASPDAIAPSADAAAPEAAGRPPASTTGAPPDSNAEGTAAESDYEALYGSPTGSGDTTSAAPSAYDPWEPYNRRMHRFNNAVDRRVALPLARTYVKAVPRPVRTGVSNFFVNLGQPLTAINSLLQGKPRQAAHSLGRFVINSTLGIGGIFDPASDAKLETANEDFGQTLGVWGWKRSRYVELPLFGPRTLRDVVGMAGDAPLSPLRQVQPDIIRVPLQGLQLVDMRMHLMSTDALREGAADDYALVRDAWMQRRAYQIDGDRMGEDSLPEYLKDKPTVVPVGAMPVSGH